MADDHLGTGSPPNRVSKRRALLSTARQALQTAGAPLNQQLRQHREAAGLSQATLAKQIGISRQTMNRIERGTGAVTWRQLAAWLKALDSAVRVVSPVGAARQGYADNMSRLRGQTLNSLPPEAQRARAPEPADTEPTI